MSKRFRASLNAELGLLCFGADWSSPVIWSHYGDKHKGICLGFDIRRSLLQEVRYEDSRLRIVLDDHPDLAQLSPELKILLSCTKARAWSYEKEFRTFVDLRTAIEDSPRHFLPFSDDMRLAEVICGERCTEDLAATRHLLAQKCPSAVAFKARLADRSFRVVLNGYTRLPTSPPH
jgi:Protein of unknown function (DUF2971)